MKRGYAIVELVIVLGIFSIIYFVMAGRASNDFNVDFDSELYNITIKAIETQAKLYGENKTDLFLSEDTIYVTVLQLAEENIIKSSSEGIVLDPRDNSKTLNDVKVKISKENDQVIAKVLV